ncbi:MAG: two-component regulator propeller domain-containing protein [Chitinophagaceae bacterium]
MNNTCQKYISVVMSLLLWCAGNNSIAQSPIYKSGIEQGLSNNSIRCIFQDHNGYMWFGTYDGLNRFDGYDFKVFRNSPRDSLSLPHNFIYSIQEDKSNRIWVGTGQGIGIYDPHTGVFVAAAYIDPADKKRKRLNTSVNMVVPDEKGNMYIGSNGMGFMVQQAGTDEAKVLPVLMNGAETYAYNAFDVKVDRFQRVWVLNDIGLCRYEPTLGKLVQAYPAIPMVRGMAADANGHVWLASDQGVFRFDPETRKLARDSRGNGITGTITSISFDGQQNLWVASEGGGVTILKGDGIGRDELKYGESKYMLNSESVFSVYEDREGRIWMGSLKGGLNVLDPFRTRFRSVVLKRPGSNEVPANNFTSSFCEDAEGNIWIGSEGGGLTKWNRAKQAVTHYRHRPGDPSSLSNNQVTNIYEDSRGEIWVATFGGGINRFRKSTGTFEHYTCFNPTEQITNQNVWQFLEDRDHVLWASTFSAGKLYRYAPEKNSFLPFDQQLNDLFALYEDKAGNMWAGDCYCLVKVDKQAKKHQYFPMGKPVRALLEDKKGRFWVGTEGGGLILFDRKQGKVLKSWSADDGLSNNAILRILEDEQGMLWITTFNGLTRFDPATAKFTRFFSSDGLQSNQFLHNAALKLRSGEFLLGGIGGANMFFPGSIAPRSYMPPLSITSLSINNLPLHEGNRYVKNEKNEPVALEVPYDDASVSVSFAALEFSAPEKISYAYFLEGWDKNWHEEGKLRQVSYPRLREGNYVLHIRSTNADGAWNPEQIRLPITVLPPWYRTWWAYAAYLLLAATGFYVLLRYRARQQELAYEMRLVKLNAEKERAEHEIEKVKSNQEKEINERRISFLTNISHEFRTPLTLIINPLKDMIRRKREEEDAPADELQIVYRNARRLLSLVDQLLLFRKSDGGEEPLKVSELNFRELCEDVYQAFTQQARLQQIELVFDCPQPVVSLFGERGKLEIILYNLLSNAMKYTPAGGKITVSLLEEQEQVLLKVADTGAGIPAHVGNRLFERFYQVEQYGVAKPGFGIGLFLVKQFVDELKAAVTYESREGEGTVFSIAFKRGHAHLQDALVEEGATGGTGLISELVDDELCAETENVAEAKQEAIIGEEPGLLVIDDDPQIRQYIAGMFTGFTVYLAENAEDGLELARRHLPDMILCDVNMPGMNGVELCAILKKDPALNFIPLILLTGSASQEMKLKAVETGADDYLTKPFDKELLLARVQSLLKNRSNLQHYFYNEVTLQDNPLKIPAEYKEFLEKCMAIVEQHIDDEQFNVKLFASELGMSHSALYKKVKSISGQSVNAFIRFIRLRKAAEILIHTPSNVNEAAFQVGISSIKYFREQFTRQFGITPSEYIRKYRKAFGRSYHLTDTTYKRK